MAVDRNMFKDASASLSAMFDGPTWCFDAVKSDVNYLVDPDSADYPNVPICSAAISLSRADEDVKVELWNGRTTTIKAGTLQAGVRYPLHIVKLWSTGTGTNVKVLVWLGESLRNLRPSAY